MSENTASPAADAVIAALGSLGTRLAALASGLSGEQLREETRPGEWTRAQVLSHLGSGAVINLATIDAALRGEPDPGGEANQGIWARWDAMGPEEQRDEFLRADAALLARYDGLDAPTRAALRTDLGFLPAPVDLSIAARFRLNEVTLHGWDLEVLDDPTATLAGDAVPLLLDQGAFMIGWVAKPEALGEATTDLAVTLTDPAEALTLHLGPQVSVGAPSDDPDGTLELPAEAWLRLLTGRLTPEHTPESVTVTGAVDLDLLRQVFPGF